MRWIAADYFEYRGLLALAASKSLRQSDSLAPAAGVGKQLRDLPGLAKRVQMVAFCQQLQLQLQSQSQSTAQKLGSSPVTTTTPAPTTPPPIPTPTTPGGFSGGSTKRKVESGVE